MESAIVTFYQTVDNRLSDIEVKDGQIIFVSDTKKIYLDLHGIRLSYSILDTLEKDEDRFGISNTSEGFYYIEETNTIWKYKSDNWIQITPNELEPLFFGEQNDFPIKGKPGVLYISTNAIYQWNTSLNIYVLIANKTEWMEMID